MKKNSAIQEAPLVSFHNSVNSQLKEMMNSAKSHGKLDEDLESISVEFIRLHKEIQQFLE